MRRIKLLIGLSLLALLLASAWVPASDEKAALLVEDALIVESEGFEFDPLADDDDEDDDDDAMIVEADPDDLEDIDQDPNDQAPDDDSDDAAPLSFESLGGGCLGEGMSCSGCGDDDDDDVNDRERCQPAKVRMYISNVHGPAEHTVEFRDLTRLKNGCGPQGRLWIWGDGKQEYGDEIIEHIYSDVGLYEVSLTIFNRAGAFTVTGPVVVQCPVPQADFEPESQTAEPGELLQFFDRSVPYPECPIETWEWDFGDGEELSFDSDPTHAFAKSGIYTVSLTVTNEGGSDTMVRNSLIHVMCGPAAPDFSASQVAGVSPLTVYFTDMTTYDPRCPIVSWYWDFGDGGNSTLQNPVHVFHGGREYDVTLTVVTEDGLEYRVTKSALIQTACAPPAPDFITDVNSGPAPLTVSFYDRTQTDEGCPVTDRLWMFGDGASVRDVVDPVHTYQTVGPKAVVLAASNAGGTASVSKPGFIVVNCPKPEANFEAYDTHGPAPLEVQFYDDSWTMIGCEIYEYEWDFGDGETSYEMNPSYIYEDPGLYSVSLKITSLGGFDVEVKYGLVIVVD
ncbi:MAG: PKD domain-containing protein [Candidatus Alcyoniella australis]|nr:PKD domain-containing protein [Candidatus Alcyoniella australis]